MIVFKEAGNGRKTLTEGNVLICRSGVVGVTTIPQTSSGLKVPSGFILVKDNIGSLYHNDNSGTLVKISEKPKYTYTDENGELVLELNRVTFTAQAMRYIGCPVGRR